jgi:hypothetical protein
VQYANSNNTDPNTQPNNDGLLIHINNGSIVAEPVGLPDRDLRADQMPTDGRRLVIPAGDGDKVMSDIVEEAPPKPAPASETENQEDKKANGAEATEGKDYAGSEEGEEEDDVSDAGSGRKSTDQLLR